MACSFACREACQDLSNYIRDATWWTGAIWNITCKLTYPEMPGNDVFTVHIANRRGPHQLCIAGMIRALRMRLP